MAVSLLGFHTFHLYLYPCTSVVRFFGNYKKIQFVVDKHPFILGTAKNDHFFILNESAGVGGSKGGNIFFLLIFGEGKECPSFCFDVENMG